MRHTDLLGIWTPEPSDENNNLKALVFKQSRHVNARKDYTTQSTTLPTNTAAMEYNTSRDRHVPVHHQYTSN
ncbi:uncharacterized [Tachysurus ichikawai]